MIYKHYAQKNEKNIITKFFSSAFRKPDENSVLFKESTKRHFNKRAKDEHGYIYKFVDGEIQERTDAERIDDYKKIKVQEINRACSTAMVSGYHDETLNITISTSPYAQANWNNLITRINNGNEPSFPYTISLIDDTTYQIDTKTKLVNLFNRASEYIDAVHKSYLQKRDEVLKSDDVDFIKNYEY